MTQWPAFVAIVTAVIGSYFTIGLVVIAWQVHQFEQRLKLLDSYPQQIRANMGPKSEQVVHVVQDCIRIQGWVRKRDVRALRASIKDIRHAMEQFRGTERWEEKGYDKLYSDVGASGTRDSRQGQGPRTGLRRIAVRASFPSTFVLSAL